MYRPGLTRRVGIHTGGISLRCDRVLYNNNIFAIGVSAGLCGFSPPSAQTP